MINEGPQAACKRDACADEPAHLSGEHLDQRSPRYDGPDHAVSALNSGPRAAARALLAAGAPVPEVIDLVQEIHRLSRSVAAVRVDMDRQVRAAADRALDCAEHGKSIKFAEEQVHFFGQQADRNDAARVALLSVLFTLEDAVSVLRGRAARGEQMPTATEIVDVIGGYLDKASRAHDRAWRKPEAKARKKKAGGPS